ncbi:MAG: RidA family protein [Chthoniobacterales bacterium]|nr:RidA family protein [Chthoniobacterales bacterium]
MKKIVSTTEAPAAVGPYSQAVRVGQMVFTAGQIPLNPQTGQIVSDDIAEQTRQVLNNLSAVLDAENLTVDHIVKTTVFMTDLGEFQTMNEVYASYFGDQPPARSTVQVSALPRGARVEIDCIAISDQTPAGKQLSVDVGE